MKDEYLRRATVRRVVDGDTIDVDVDLGYKITTHQRLRLARINAPEVRGKERAKGLKTKEYVELMLGACEGMALSTVYIQSFKSGKYGRYIAEVFYYNPVEHRWANLNDELLQRKLAKPYKGRM